jgi:DNA-binding NarL/FixJ family response regulator
VPGESPTNQNGKNILVIKILCVDDSPDLMRLICVAVSREADMEVAGKLHSAAGLIDELRSKQPDVVILDVGMPGTDANELLRQISAARPSTRVVMYSGYDDPETRDNALNAGASSYVSKGEGLESLFRAVRKVARGARAA